MTRLAPPGRAVIQASRRSGHNGMIGDVLPADVTFAESFGDTSPAVLPSEEAAVVAGSVPKRQRQFAGARTCARRALASLGVPTQAVLSGSRGEPLWPPHVVGSLTHCDG